MKKTILIIFALLCTSAIVMAVIPKIDGKDSRQPVYKVIFDGYPLYDGKTDEPSTGLYQAGEKVVLYFPFIATDTNYYFYLDGKEINSSDYSHERGFIFEFIMPEHDVTFSWTSRNTMVNYVE